MRVFGNVQKCGATLNDVLLLLCMNRSYHGFRRHSETQPRFYNVLAESRFI